MRTVTAGGPAEASGIKRSDIIIAVNDEEVKDSRELTQRVGSLLAGIDATSSRSSATARSRSSR